eukprot:Partr_v1_DN23523_c0_g1_i3_m14234 putative grancalcin, EF-hand calcium binding protein
MTDLLDYFNASDKNRDGSINADELQQCLSNGTWKPFNVETVKLMIHLFDKDNDGQINFGEFTGLWAYITEWQRTFSAYATVNMLTLSLPELHLALKNSNLEVPVEIVRGMMLKFNASGAFIDFDDFIHISILTQKIYKEFSKLDSDKDDKITIDRGQFLKSVFKLITPVGTLSSSTV